MKGLIVFISTCVVCIGAFGAVSGMRNNSNIKNPRSATAQKTNSRTNAIMRSDATAKLSRRATQASTTKHTSTEHVATRRIATRTVAQDAANVIARAAIKMPTVAQTFGTNYDTCRDAYFTCMDQFCAQQNDAYRRCVCSSRLESVQARESALSKTADSLQDFKELNIPIITKSQQEVQAMLSASDGEVAASYSRDKSAAVKELAGISAVIANTKSNALSTSGKLDIGGDIKSIWSTTDLAGGASIANLTGEKLYNAVHNQCNELVREMCNSDTTLRMVASAYGMYIENDCTALVNALDKKINEANTAIRDTEKEMHTARLENYDNHNSLPINDCIAKVRTDITADTACGKNFVHCLDMTGKYLNYDTGEPIYTAQFYQLADMISLDGDILNNQRNDNVVVAMNRMRDYAAHSLDSCRDVADSVWNEFMRQAIAEIYQGQQVRIRQVKNDCLDVVNQCYDEQNQQLRDFSNVKEQLLLGARLELSEKMCQEKMDTCSNLYGGGSDGLRELLTAMHDIVDQRIAKDCLNTLQNYARDLCGVSSTSTTHKYPYACRSYAPGDSEYAVNACCNNPTSDTDCTHVDCSAYNSSLYKKLVEYAKQACVRPSAAEIPGYVIPTSVLADVNYVMDSVKVDMVAELSPECETLGGYWVSAAWMDNKTYRHTGSNATIVVDGADGYHDQTAHTLLSRFYLEISASPNWGYCADSDSLDNYNTYGNGLFLQILKEFNPVENKVKTINYSSAFGNP